MNRRQLTKMNNLMHGHRIFAAGLFVVMLLAAVAQSLGLSLILPLLSGMVGSSGLSGRVVQFTEFCLAIFPERYQLIGLLSALTLLFLCKNLLLILQKKMTANFVNILRKEWSARMLNNYLTSRYDDIISQKSGALLNNVVTEPFRASKGVYLILEALSKMTFILNIIILLLLVNLKITLGLLAAVAIIFMLVKVRMHNYSLKIGKKRVRLSQEITSCAMEALSGLKLIKSFGLEGTFHKNISDLLEKYRKIDTSFKVLSELPNCSVEVLIIVMITLSAIILQVFFDINFQNIIPLLGIFLVAALQLFYETANVLSSRMKIISGIPSLSLVYDMLHNERAAEDYDSGETTGTLSGDIIFRDIAFTHKSNVEPLFSGMSMTIEHGKMTALVGPSGSGKSTIADMLMRFVLPDGGSIMLQGKNIQAMNLAVWRQAVGYVSQEPYLFNGSIRDNILIGKPEATEQEITAAARLANAHEFIAAMPMGYDTQLGTAGLKISGGQRQRIAIARAIIRKPQLLIFDEATSSLDHESEKCVQKSIEDLRGGNNTILVIAHRLSTIENADRIYQLSGDGKVEEVVFSSLTSPTGMA